MPESNEGHYTCELKTFPAEPRVGDYVTLVLEMYNIHNAGQIQYHLCFQCIEALGGWRIVSGDETSSFEFDGHYANLVVETAGTNSLRPYIDKSGFDLTAGHNHTVLISYNLSGGEAIITGVKFGNNEITVYENLTSDSVAIELGEWDGVNSLKIYFDGTKEFDLGLYEITIYDTTLESKEEDWTMFWNVGYFIFDPYHNGLLKYISNRHVGRLYNETAWHAGDEENALTLLCFSKPWNGQIIYTPNNLQGTELGYMNMYRWHYHGYNRLYFDFCAREAGIVEIIYIADAIAVIGQKPFSTGIKSHSFEIKPKIEDTRNSNLTAVSDVVGSRVVEKEQNIPINQVARNVGDFDLEDLKMNVQPNTKYLEYRKDDIDWTKEKGGS